MTTLEDDARGSPADPGGRAPANLAELERANEILRMEIAELRQAEEKFRVLLESAPDAIILTDRAGRIALVNSLAEQWFGYSRDQLIGQPVEILVPKSMRGRHQEHRREYVGHPRTRPMGIGLPLYGVRKDGSEFPVEISLSPIRTGDELLVTTIIRDISERKRAEEARFEIQERYRELANNLPVAVFRYQTDPRERFLEANRTMVTLFEAGTLDGLLAHRVDELFPDPKRYRQFADALQRSGTFRAHELEMVTLSGKPFWAAITAVTKAGEGGQRFVDGLVEDITDSMQARRQIHELNERLQDRARDLEAVNKELEAFSYSVSHDLRAPLRAIDGFSQALLEDCRDRLDAHGQDYLQRVRAASQRMAELIDDMLMLSRVTRAEIRRGTVDVSALADEIAVALRLAQPGRDADIRVEPGLTADGDSKLLRILLENLLSNAWKFTGKRPQAVIEIGARRDEAGRPVYFVRDNGAGFDMAYAQKLFNPFQRLHAPSEFPGSGIGLATVQRIVNRHGGRAWAEGKPDEGATFFFTLA